MWCKNIAGRLFGLVTKHACDRRTYGQTDRLHDGRTDRQNYDSQDRASIAASRGKNNVDPVKTYHSAVIYNQRPSNVLRHHIMCCGALSEAAVGLSVRMSVCPML